MSIRCTLISIYPLHVSHGEDMWILFCIPYVYTAKIQAPQQVHSQTLTVLRRYFKCMLSLLLNILLSMFKLYSKAWKSLDRISSIVCSQHDLTSVIYAMVRPYGVMKGLQSISVHQRTPSVVSSCEITFPSMFIRTLILEDQGMFSHFPKPFSGTCGIIYRFGCAFRFGREQKTMQLHVRGS